MFKKISFFFLVLIIAVGCEQKKNKLTTTKEIISKNENTNCPEGMVWISGGVFERGAIINDKYARDDEFPKHKIKLDGFFIDVTEVTNKQFQKFVDETGYITVAEKSIEWNDLKKQVPEGTKKPHDSLLKPGSLSFHCSSNTVSNLNDYSQWWVWKTGANWKHPKGKGSTIKNKENHPVVHIAYEDAVAYCKWAKRRLPTEAEWEYAARGGIENAIYSWGNNHKLLNDYANTWQGVFPTLNIKEDGFDRTAPVASFPANNYGLYDMLGNVWEWTQDWYSYKYYDELNAKNKIIKNPKGPYKANNKLNPLSQEKVIRGGSFLCHNSYCSSYRVSARMASSYDTGLEHLGFRTVLDSVNISK